MNYTKYLPTEIIWNTPPRLDVAEKPSKAYYEQVTIPNQERKVTAIQQPSEPQQAGFYGFRY